LKIVGIQDEKDRRIAKNRSSIQISIHHQSAVSKNARNCAMTQQITSSVQNRHRLNIQFKVETVDHQRVTLFVESLSEQPELYKVLESMHDKGTPLPNPLSPNVAARLIMFALLRHRLFLRTERQQDELDSLPELHAKLSAATAQVSELQNVRQEMIDEKDKNAELLESQELLKASLEELRKENARLEELNNANDDINQNKLANVSDVSQLETFHEALQETNGIIRNLTEALQVSDDEGNTRDVLWLVKCNFRDLANSVEQIAESMGCDITPLDVDDVDDVNDVNDSEESHGIRSCLQEILSIQQNTNETTNEMHEAFTSVMQKLAEPLLERARLSDYEKLRSYKKEVNKAVDDVIARNISLNKLFNLLKTHR